MWKDTTARLRVLPAVVWGLGLVALFTDVASDMIVPLLPALLSSVGGGAIALGAMEGVAEAASAALKLGSGRLVDRGVRPGPLVVAGYALAALVRPLFAVIGAPWHAVVLRSLDRIGKGIRSAPRDGILAAAVAPGQRGLAFGVHTAMDNLGAVIGALVAFVLLGPLELGVKDVILLSVLPGVASTMVAAFVLVRDRRKIDAEARRSARPAAPEPRAPLVPLGSQPRRLLGVIALFSLGASSDAFLIAHLLAQGLAVKWLPLAWICLQLGKAMLNVPGGAFADRIGPRRSLIAGWWVYAAAYLGFMLSPSPEVTWAIFALYAIHFGLGEGAEKALIASLVPASARGRAFGALHAVSGLMLLPANLLFGVLYQRSQAVAFAVGAAAAALSAVALAALIHPAPPADELTAR